MGHIFGDDDGLGFGVYGYSDRDRFGVPVINLSKIGSYGVVGYSFLDAGVYGEGASRGIFGYSRINEGVPGVSESAIGVIGVSDGTAPWATGVAGRGINCYGVLGECPYGFGVYGHSISSGGVYGYSEGNIGVRGRSDSGFGVFGTSSFHDGVVGNSDQDVMVLLVLVATAMELVASALIATDYMASAPTAMLHI